MQARELGLTHGMIQRDLYGTHPTAKIVLAVAAAVAAIGAIGSAKKGAAAV